MSYAGYEGYEDYLARIRGESGGNRWPMTVATALQSDYGELRVRRMDDGALEILQADPQILISEHLIDLWETWPGAWPDVFWGDNILTIRGHNRTVSYGCVGRVSTHRARLAVLSPEIGITDAC